MGWNELEITAPGHPLLSEFARQRPHAYFVHSYHLAAASVSDVLARVEYGGAITAALFLGHFVDDVPHAHVDIAGPVWSGKDSCATGFGAKTMAAWVEARAAASDFGAPF